MRGLLATALLAPALASALVVPNTWDGADITSATRTAEISHAVNLNIPLLTTASVVSSSSLSFEIDLARSGTECGSGDLVVNGIPVPYGTTGSLELTGYLGLKNIQMKWDLSCGPLTRTLVFAVKNINGERVGDLGLTVLYSQNDNSLEILDIKKFSKNPKPVYLELSSDESPFKGRLRIEEDPNAQSGHRPHGVQAPIKETPSTDDVDAIHGIALCNSAKCVFMVAFHNTKETAKHIASKVKSVFCHGKPGEPRPPKSHEPGRHGGKHHDEHNVDRYNMRPGHEETISDGRHYHEEDRPYRPDSHGP
ncbi:hypothetical protein V491_01525, partial [Pseudogymnoascus sp. VKM F-3775]